MSRIRLILLGLLAVAVVAVVASASASANRRPPAVGKSRRRRTTASPGSSWKTRRANDLGKSRRHERRQSILKGTIASVTSEIKCGKGKSTGTIEDGAAGTVGKSKATITFEECRLVKPGHCKLTSAEEKEIETTDLKGELELISGRIEDKLEPKTGCLCRDQHRRQRIFVWDCGSRETQNLHITGSQLCEVDSSKAEAETEAEKHKLICKSLRGSLKIGGNLAEMTDGTTRRTERRKSARCLERQRTHVNPSGKRLHKLLGGGRSAPW